MKKKTDFQIIARNMYVFVGEINKKQFINQLVAKKKKINLYNITSKEKKKKLRNENFLCFAFDKIFRFLNFMRNGKE